MKFKQPRSGDTEANYVSARRPRYGERCGVGTGECSELAVDVADGGSPDCQMPLCAAHKEEFVALMKLINEMTPNQIAAFDNAITKAERK